MAEMVGRQLAERYWVLREQRIGATDLTYLGYDEGSSAYVSLRVLRPDLEDSGVALALLGREAKALQGIVSPRVTPLVEYHEKTPSPLLVTGWPPGRSLHEILERRRTLTAGECLRLSIQIAEGLVALAAHGIVHRGLSPRSVFVDVSGDVKIAAPGLLFPVGVAGLLPDGLVAPGDLSYMSPEQLRAGEAIDAASDLYSLGVLMYRMVTGLVPFAGQSIPETVMMVQKRPVLPPSQFVPGLSSDLEDMVMRLLGKDRARRLSDPAAALSALKRVSLSHEVLRWSTARLVHAGGTAFDVGWRGLTLIGRVDPTRQHVPDVDLFGLDTSRSVSRSHAILFQDQGQHYLRADSASRGATFVGKTKVTADKPVPLAESAALRMGDVPLSFSVS